MVVAVRQFLLVQLDHLAGLAGLAAQVKEKPIVGYVRNGELYDYFDKEGFVVLESSALIEGVPYIEGIGMGEVKLYQQLESKNKKIFQQILETSREIPNTS